jgi:hypothetical protein
MNGGGPGSNVSQQVAMCPNIKFMIFFKKLCFAKSVRNVRFVFLYIIKYVKIPAYEVTVLLFIFFGEGSHTQDGIGRGGGRGPLVTVTEVCEPNR